MQEIIDFLKANPFVFIGTTEGPTPHVRPFQFQFGENGKLYFTTANTKDVYRQLKANPAVEFAALSRDMVTLRVSGEVKFTGDRSVKARILDNSELVKKIYKTPDNPILEAFYLEHGTAVFQYLTGQPPKTVGF